MVAKNLQVLKLNTSWQLEPHEINTAPSLREISRAQYVAGTQHNHWGQALTQLSSLILPDTLYFYFAFFLKLKYS